MDFLDSLLDNIDEAVIITDPTGRILMFNKPALTQSQSLQAVRPLKEGEFLADVSEKRRRAIRGIIRGLNIRKRPEKSFAEYTSEQGTTVYLDLDYIPILNNDRDLTHIYVLARDITQQKVYERKLMSQSTNTSSMVETASAIIIGVDMLGYITGWNEHCTMVTGFTKTDAYTRKISDLMQTGEGSWEIIDHTAREIAVTTKTGKHITLLLSRSPQTTVTGQLIGFTFVGQDVTELAGYRRSLEMQVEERTALAQQSLKKEKDAVAVKSRFVFNASHELRTPLSTIQFAADFIKKHHAVVDTTMMLGKLEAIDNQVTLMANLLDDLLLYSRGDAGNASLKEVKIVALLYSIAAEIGHYYKHSHDIITDFHNLPETFVSDEKLLRSIVTNLLSNAIKYSPGKIFVELIVRHLSGDLIINIKDHGMGISETELTRIYEPFVRGLGVTEIRGTGLGLSIVQKAVDLLGGTISVNSQISSGTIFTVTLPELHQEQKKH